LHIFPVYPAACPAYDCITIIITNSIGQSPTLNAASSSSSQEIVHILYKLNVKHSLPLFLLLSISINSAFFQTKFLIYILILSSNLCLCVLIGFFIWVTQPKPCMQFFPSRAVRGPVQQVTSCQYPVNRQLVTFLRAEAECSLPGWSGAKSYLAPKAVKKFRPLISSSISFVGGGVLTPG
jgi:hypothetical protein